MSEFYTTLNEYLGEQDDVMDIRAVVRRCWFYDFTDQPVRLWQGQGKLFTSDGNEWLGTIDANGQDYHKTPAMQDGRDGSSPSYRMSMPIVDLPGEPAFKLYEELKADQWRVSGNRVICYLAIFNQGEALRPQTPLSFFKEFTMFAPQFSEKVEVNAAGTLVKKYSVSVTAKDNNYGRSNTPRGTYADTIQKERARQLGVSLDRGSEFLGLLANRTYQIP
jgi:hypothetical protein